MKLVLKVSINQIQIKHGAVEGNAVQLMIGFAVLRLELLFGSIHRPATALPVAEHVDEGLCQALASPALLCASCCDVFAALQTQLGLKGPCAAQRGTYTPHLSLVHRRNVNF